MRQAVLITAYKNIEQILEIIYFMGEDFEFYIHIDKKSSMNLSKIKTINNVHIFKQYKVNWGSINHLKVILLLSKAAISDTRNGFFHLITGQDFPVKPIKYFLEELNKTRDYLEYFQIPSECWSGNGGMDRIELYNPYEIFDKKTLIGKIILKLVVKTQKILNMKRKMPKNIFKKLYGGSTYWSLTRDSLKYVLEFTENNEETLKRMRFTFCSEEIYFQTVLLNSPYSKNIIDDNLRYIDWSTGRGGYPAFLDNKK